MNVFTVFPLPELPIVAALSFALSFWYGYRNPREF